MTQKEKEIVDEMLNLIQRIKDNTDYIDTAERIPQLELDVIVARIQKLYELSVALKYFHANLDDIMRANGQRNESISKISEETIEFDSILEDEIIEKEELLKEEIEKLSKTPIIEPTKEPVKNIQEKLSTIEDESVAHKLRLQPIRDLKSAIEINAKFQYINDLFNGNSTVYNQTIDKINNASSYDNALEIVKPFNWDKDNKVALSFLNLIARRFL